MWSRSRMERSRRKRKRSAMGKEEEDKEKKKCRLEVMKRRIRRSKKRWRRMLQLPATSCHHRNKRSQRLNRITGKAPIKQSTNNQMKLVEQSRNAKIKWSAVERNSVSDVLPS